jgi:hypothetical protein
MPTHIRQTPRVCNLALRRCDGSTSKNEATLAKTRQAILWSLASLGFPSRTAFLIVHWKHTLNLISLLDVIPGDGTELISE